MCDARLFSSAPMVYDFPHCLRWFLFFAPRAFVLRFFCCCFVVHLIHAIKDLAHPLAGCTCFVHFRGKWETLFWHIFLVYVSLDPPSVASRCFSLLFRFFVGPACMPTRRMLDNCFGIWQRLWHGKWLASICLAGFLIVFAQRPEGVGGHAGPAFHVSHSIMSFRAFNTNR